MTLNTMLLHGSRIYLTLWKLVMDLIRLNTLNRINLVSNCKNYTKCHRTHSVLSLIYTTHYYCHEQISFTFLNSKPYNKYYSE